MGRLPYGKLERRPCDALSRPTACARGAHPCAGALEGAALAALGERERGPERLEQAVAVYTEALKECAGAPRGPWCRTISAPPCDLEQAVAAFTEWLKERTRERVPLNWAETQSNLGAALVTLGKREGGPERLEQAVAAFTEALKERTRERVPLDWAETQNNLGAALATLGEREGGPEYLEQAVAAFTEALKERTRALVPLNWAETQNNLGHAIQILRERGRAV